jgi:hypothetical protein
MRHLWFRLLDARALRRLRRDIARGQARGFACDMTDAARRALSRAPLPHGALRVLPISLAVEDRAGRNIRARIELLRAVMARHAAGAIGDREWLPAPQRAWRAEWQRIGAAHDLEVDRPAAEFLAFVENAYGTGEIGPAEEIVVVVGRHAAAAPAMAHVRPLLQFPGSFILRGKAPHPAVATIVEMGRLLGRAAVICARRVLRGPARRFELEREVHAGEASIALIQYEAGMMDRLPVGATQDWIEHSGLPPRRIVYYFNRADSPLDAATRDALSRRGFGWIDYALSWRHLHDRDRLFFNCFAALLSAAAMVRDRGGLARWLLLAQTLPQVAVHREFLRLNRVAVLHQHGEFTPGQMALNLACRQEGVAFVWGFWSALVFTSAWYQNAFADLLLAWGGYDLGHCNVLSFDYRYAVECGVLGYDGREPDDAERAAVLRARLSARPRFVVALLDSSHTVRSIHQSTERCVLFYRTVLALVRDNPDWGCVIKSKATSYDELPAVPGLQDAVAELEAQGRCARLVGEIKPTLAALAADAVVCFSVNSAGIQAALGSGRPTLHFDPNSLTMHPLTVAGGDGKIIFRDEDSFSAALRAIAAGDRSFGDLTPWAHLFDPFRDGMGRRRSGEVMRDYMAARDRGLSRDEALRVAVEAHAARYGAGRATTRHVTHDAPGDQLWRKVQRLHYPDWPSDMPFTDGSRVPPIAISKDAAA